METKNFHYECENCNTCGNCDICKNLKIKGIVEVKCGGSYDGDEVNIKPEIIKPQFNFQQLNYLKISNNFINRFIF